MKKKRLVIALGVVFLVSAIFAAYVKSTYTQFPPIFQMPDSHYIMSEGFQHFFDNEDRTLGELMELSDAVVIARRSDEGTWVGRSIRTHLTIIKCIKGDVKDNVTYYEPVEYHPTGILAVHGYLPMLMEHTYLLFLQKVDDPMREDEYYPLCGDIAKYEQGNYAYLREMRDYTYGEVMTDAVLLYDEDGIFLRPKKRVEVYNEIMKEIEERRLWE